MKEVLLTIALIILILLIIIFRILVGNNIPTPIVKKKECGPNIVLIQGYTYYKFTQFKMGYMAPTPDTLKRCMKEVMKKEHITAN